MTLSYARQQQLDNAVKNFVEGLQDPRLLEFINEPVDSDEDVDKSNVFYQESIMVREHLADLLNVSLHDVITLNVLSNSYRVLAPSSVTTVPAGVTYDRANGYIYISQHYINELLRQSEDNQQKSTTMYKGQPTNIVPSVDTAKPCVSVKQEMSHMAPMHTNVAGGKQSHVARDYTLIPQEALASLARVMYNGAMKYSKDNWKLIHKRDHLNHALNHINLYLAGNVTEDHLAHAATRMMMALELDLTEENDDA